DRRAVDGRSHRGLLVDGRVAQELGRGGTVAHEAVAAAGVVVAALAAPAGGPPVVGQNHRFRSPTRHCRLQVPWCRRGRWLRIACCPPLSAGAGPDLRPVRPYHAGREPLERGSLAGSPLDEAVAWVRQAYDRRAVETRWQRRWVLDI